MPFTSRSINETCSCAWWAGLKDIENCRDDQASAANVSHYGRTVRWGLVVRALVSDTK